MRSAPALLRRVPPALRGHPSTRALERHWACPAGGRVARHVRTCDACRAWLDWRGALRAAAGATAAATLPIDPAGTVLTGALRRRAAGERVHILPSAEPVRRAAHAPGTPSRAWLVGAAAAGAALAATFLARPQPMADAGTVAGTLTLRPAVPRAGDTLTVRYEPSGLLAGAPRLRLRAAYHPDDDARPWSRPAVTAAWLAPGPDGAYVARVVLPAGTAYARFAVEDSAAGTVDAHGRQPWDVIMGDATGRPRIAGIRSQGMVSLFDRSQWERTRAIVVEATRLHPDHPSGWWLRTQQDAELAGSARADRVAAVARPLVARLDGALARERTRESWAMVDLAAFAEFVGAPTVSDRWRARLMAEAPQSVAAYSWHVTRLWQAKAAPAAQIDSLERWWRMSGDSVALFYTQAVGLALAAHDIAAARRWAARAAADPATRLTLARMLLADPALAADALVYARSDLARAEATNSAADAERPLDLTAAAWARERARRARAALAVVGEGLLTLGRPSEAAAALARATADGWDADALRALGEARLALGDTAAALDGYARAAADPVVGPRVAGASLVRTVARDPARAAAWARAVAAARDTMHARVLGRTTAERLPGDPRVADAGGRRRPLSEIRAGRVAVVAMLSPYCGPALADLPALARLRANTGAAAPVAFIAVTQQAPGGPAAGAFRERGLTLPLWYDVDGQATAMLEARGTPTYLVLDPAGTVRWRGHSIREAAPVIDALTARVARAR